MSNKAKIREDAMSLNLIDDALFCKMAEDIISARGGVMSEEYVLESWENAGLSNNFIFRLAMDDTDICHEQLEVLLDTKVAKIDFKEHEKEYEHDKFRKGIRLDVYIQDKDGMVYDLEMQVGEQEKAYLPCRTRYYQSKMDGDLLAKGKSYRYLKNTIIIFICTFDPFDLNLSKYTLVTKCLEAPEMPVNNRTMTIFFNTKGDRKGLTERQKAFLDYVDGKGVQDEFTAKLDERVKFVKMDSGKKAEFMTWQQELIEQQEIGKEKAELDSIIKLLKKNKSIEEIAEWLDFTVERVSMVAKANGFA